MPIAYYTIVHSVKGTSTINLRLQNGSTASLTGLSVAEAGYIIDILRNEKHVNWIAGQNLISSGVLLPVGEDEPAAPFRVVATTTTVAQRKNARRS